MDGLSPRGRGRFVACFALIEAACSLLGQQYVVGMTLVSRDAAATANNILANESLYRSGVVLSLLAVVFHLAVGLLLYDLLRVASRTVALYSVFALIVAGALQAVAGVLLLAPLIVLGGGDALGAFTPDQLHALALTLLKWNVQAYDIYLAFFGVWLVSIGYLVFRSTFLPRPIGAALAIEGLGWATYLWPSFGIMLFPAIALFGLFGELALYAWLLKGIDSARWKALAARSERVL